ncbi:LysR substrate-binding domain-containing protein [Paraburkholderia terrae]|uniref:LysR substrate-binding domain-containing protein n=1 Tax=Paraburkholderia terrae TaxID=311230 RepID=UPI00296AAECE|nr:LysR substrate-binding domain-containing protein [Paraburkholderia terrae]MDW3656283.1 LysR substrate-binding domain-containing protein [Paraburkholderia terrae]
MAIHRVYIMDVADLKVFDAVARLGSMSRAALELHTVQSNVTGRIRSLEGEVGVALFERHVRGVKMTPAGQRMLPYAARAARLVADARLAALDDGPPCGTLAIGALWTTGALQLSRALSHFASLYPQVGLSLTTGTSDGLTDAVAECRLDGAFVAGPQDDPGLDVETVFREELVLVTPAAMRSLNEVGSVGNLKTIVFSQGCSYRERLDLLLAEMGILSVAALAFGSIDAILSCVAAGIGITLLPRGIVSNAEQRNHVAVHALASDTARMETLFVRRRDAYLSNAMRAFLDVARSEAGPLP